MNIYQNTSRTIWRILFGVSCCCFKTAKSDMVNREVFRNDLFKTTPQDCGAFIQGSSQPDQPVVEYDIAQVQKSFLSNYFSPWEDPFAFFDPEELCREEEKKLQKYSSKEPERRGWGLNRQPHTEEFIRTIKENMALSTFPNQQQPAVTVRTTNLRTIPSENASFNCPEHGEDYPFDNWQESLLSPNEPLHVLHTSQDQAWNFVITGSYICGWVKRADIAYATPEFIKQWKTEQYVVPLRDQVLIKGNILAPLARVGQLIPLADKQNSDTHYQILTVVSDLEGWAMLQVNTVSKVTTTLFPLLATPNNMVQLANSLMGQPYGWGGIEGYRDCSSLIKDLFATFGVWLPRNSSSQSKAGTYISLEKLDNDQKEALIKKRGIPFFSLIWMSGHIMLYIGIQGEKSYVYNNLWSLRTRSLTGKAGKVIFGKTVIMPLDFGKAHNNVEKTLLGKVKGLILLEDRLAKPAEPLALFKR